MSTDIATTTDTEETGPVALLFELEGVAVPCRKKLYDILRKHLAGAGVQLTPGLFSRAGLRGTPEQAVESLIAAAGGDKAEASRVAADVAEAFGADIRSDRVQVSAPVLKLLQTAQKRGLVLGALSALPEIDAQALVDRLGLAEVVLQAGKPADAVFPRADCWLKLSKNTSRSRRSVIAVASGMAGCKSALAAGLRCIVVSDEFTAFEDFSGADFIIDNWDDASPNDVLSALGVTAR